MIQFENFNRSRKCPKCKKLHLSEDIFCEHCLHNLLDDVPQIGNFIFEGKLHGK